jgi:hypothetical protein
LAKLMLFVTISLATWSIIKPNYSLLLKQEIRKEE